MRTQRSRPTTLRDRDQTLAVHGGVPRLCTVEAWSAGGQVESAGAFFAPGQAIYANIHAVQLYKR